MNLRLAIAAAILLVGLMFVYNDSTGNKTDISAQNQSAQEVSGKTCDKAKSDCSSKCSKSAAALQASGESSCSKSKEATLAAGTEGKKCCPSKAKATLASGEASTCTKSLGQTASTAQCPVTGKAQQASAEKKSGCCPSKKAPVATVAVK